jgi:hypothetical protein
VSISRDSKPRETTKNGSGQAEKEEGTVGMTPGGVLFSQVLMSPR